MAILNIIFVCNLPHFVQYTFRYVNTYYAKLYSLLLLLFSLSIVTCIPKLCMMCFDVFDICDNIQLISYGFMVIA
jgi:hypothetical protein